jgi:hypothetical protein
LHAENIFVGFVVPENKIFYAALVLSADARQDASQCVVPAEKRT